MTIKDSGSERIAQLVAAYGSDVARWPQAGRLLIQSLPPEERAEILRDESALDALIARAAEAADNAPLPDGLMARVLEAAKTTSGALNSSTHPASKVVALRPVSPDRARQPQNRSGVHRQDWVTAAAVLAASLILGIFVGSTDLGRSTALALGDFAGLDVSMSNMQMTALDEALQAQDDEDLL